MKTDDWVVGGVKNELWKVFVKLSIPLFIRMMKHIAQFKSFTIFPRWCSRVYHFKLSSKLYSKVIRNKRLIVDLEISKERERRCLTEKLFDILSVRFHCVSQGSDADAELAVTTLLRLSQPLATPRVRCRPRPHEIDISAPRRSTGKLANCVQFIAWKSSIYYLVR